MRTFAGIFIGVLFLAFAILLIYTKCQAIKNGQKTQIDFKDVRDAFKGPGKKEEEKE